MENNADSFFNKVFRVYLLNVINDAAYKDHLSEQIIQQWKVEEKPSEKPQHLLWEVKKKKKEGEIREAA